MRLLIILAVFLFGAHVGAEEVIESPAFFQKQVVESVQKILNSNKTAFCESYEDYEDCPSNPPGPDSSDDGDGGREGDGSGPDDVGDGF